MLDKLKQLVKPDLDELRNPHTARYLAFLLCFTGLAMIFLPELVIFTSPDPKERQALVNVGVGALVVGALFAVLAYRRPSQGGSR